MRRKASAKKFRKACKGMNEWLRQICGRAKLKEWWPTLRSKLRVHYQYYGISGNNQAIERYHYVTKRLVFKWVNRRSRKASFTWEGFNAYLEHYPLPEPCIVHYLYTLSFVS
jgi:RNA-directed DNA polymerase